MHTAVKIFHLSQVRPCANFLLCAELSAPSLQSAGTHPEPTLAGFEVRETEGKGLAGRPWEVRDELRAKEKLRHGRPAFSNGPFLSLTTQFPKTIV